MSYEDRIDVLVKLCERYLESFCSKPIRGLIVVLMIQCLKKEISVEGLKDMATLLETYFRKDDMSERVAEEIRKAFETSMKDNVMKVDMIYQKYSEIDKEREELGIVDEEGDGIIANKEIQKMCHAVLQKCLDGEIEQAVFEDTLFFLDGFIEKYYTEVDIMKITDMLNRYVEALQEERNVIRERQWLLVELHKMKNNHYYMPIDCEVKLNKYCKSVQEITHILLSKRMVGKIGKGKFSKLFEELMTFTEKEYQEMDLLWYKRRI